MEPASIGEGCDREEEREGDEVEPSACRIRAQPFEQGVDCLYGLLVLSRESLLSDGLGAAFEAAIVAELEEGLELFEAGLGGGFARHPGKGSAKTGFAQGAGKFFRAGRVNFRLGLWGLASWGGA
jgi:hypothetical protein